MKPIKSCHFKPQCFDNFYKLGLILFGVFIDPSEASSALSESTEDTLNLSRFSKVKADLSVMGDCVNFSSSESMVISITSDDWCGLECRWLLAFFLTLKNMSTVVCELDSCLADLDVFFLPKKIYLT